MPAEFGGVACPKPSKFDRVLREQDEKSKRDKAKRESYALVDVRDQRQCVICGRKGNPYATTTLGRLHHAHLLDLSLGGVFEPWCIFLACWICHALIHAKQLFVLGSNANEQLQFEIEEAAVTHVFGAEQLPKHVRIILPGGERTL